MADAVDGIGGSLRRVFEIASGVNLANMFDTVVSSAVRAGTALVKLGLETQRQEAAFASITKSLGVHGDSLQAEMEKASRGLINVSDVLDSAATSLLEGLKPEQLIKLVDIATVQAQRMGVTATEAYNKLNEALLTNTERGFKSARVYLDLDAAWDKHARTIGTTTDRLTDSEKRLASYNELVRKTADNVAVMSAGQLTNAQQVEKATTAWKNLAETMGKALVDALKTAAVETVSFTEKLLPHVIAVDNVVKAWARWSIAMMGLKVSGPSILDVKTGPGVGDMDQGLANAAVAMSNLGTNSAAAGPKIRDTAASIKAAAAEAEKAAKALASFQQGLISAAITDETARSLVDLRQKVADLSAEFPQLAARFQAIGVAREAIIVTARQTADALKAEAEAWKETDAIVSEMETGLMELAAPLSTAGDLATRFAVTGDDVTFSLGGATTAVIAFGAAFRTLAQPAEEAIDMLVQFGPTLTEIDKATLTFEESMRQAGLSSRILGDDFDFAGARIAALRSQFDSLVRASQGEWTPEIQRVGDELRRSLADQSLFRSIESGFLSITDTFTKMADGLIQGTLDIGDAFANLGRNLLTNFVQIVLHQVFDPILKEAASFVSGLIGLLTGRGGGGGLATAGGLLGGVLGAFGVGGGNISAEQFSAIGLAGAGGGGGGGDTLGTLGGAASGLSTLYGVIQQLGASTGLIKLPTLMSLASDGITSLASSIGLLGSNISVDAFSAIGLAAASAGPEAASLGAEGAALVTSGVAGGIGAGALILAPLAIGMLAQTLFGRTREDARWERYQQARQAQAMTGDVGGGLSGLTLTNALEEPRRKFLETLKAFAEFSAIVPKMQEARRLSGTLTTADIPGSQYTAEGQAPAFSDVLPFDQSPVLKEAESLVNSLTKLGIDASHKWAQTSKELGSTTLFQNFDDWNRLVVAYSKALENLSGTGSGVEDAATSLARVRIEAAITAESLDTIADVLGVARQAIPDFTEATAEAIPAMIATMKSNLADAFLSEPIKIAGLLDLGSLQKEGEDIKDTFTRVATSLQGLGTMMKNLDAEAEALRGTLDVPAQYAKAMGQIAKAMSDAQGLLAGTRDPEEMLAAAQQLDALIRERYKLETETVAALIWSYRQYAAVVTNTVSAITSAASTLDDLGVSIVGMTAATAMFVSGMHDAVSQINALPALIASAFAEAGQVARASGSANTGLDVILAGPVDALRDTFTEVMNILDPSARASALQGFLAQIDSFFKQAVSGIHSYYDELRTQARTLLDNYLTDLRAAAQAQAAALTAPMQATLDAARSGLEAIAAQRGAVQGQIEAIQEVLQVRLDALNEERDAINEQISAIRDAAQVRVDALNEERDGLNDILQASRAAAQVAKSLRDAISGLEIGDLAPPDAEAQFAAARLAFDTARPEDAGAAGRALLETGLRTGLLTRPDPEFAQLFEEVTARLRSLAESAEAQVTPEEQSLARLASIDAEITSLNAETKARLRPLEGSLSSIDDEVKSLNAQAKAALKPLQDTLKSLDAQSKDLNGSIDVLTTGIEAINKNIQAQLAGDEAAAQAQFEVYLAGLSKEETDAVDRVKNALAPLAQQTVAAVYSTTQIVGNLASVAQHQLTAILDGLSYDAFIANRTDAMADALEGLSGSIHDSLYSLVSTRLDGLLQLGGGAEAIRAALNPDLSRIIANTADTAGNVVWLGHVAAGNIGALGFMRLPSAQWGMSDTGEGGLVLTHPHERILTAAENRSYGSGGGGAMTLTVNVDARGAADPQATAAAVRREVEKLWDGPLRAKIQDLRRRS